MVLYGIIDPIAVTKNFLALSGRQELFLLLLHDQIPTGILPISLRLYPISFATAILNQQMK